GLQMRARLRAPGRRLRQKSFIQAEIHHDVAVVVSLVRTKFRPKAGKGYRLRRLLPAVLAIAPQQPCQLHLAGAIFLHKFPHGRPRRLERDARVEALFQHRRFAPVHRGNRKLEHAALPCLARQHLHRLRQSRQYLRRALRRKPQTQPNVIAHPFSLARTPRQADNGKWSGARARAHREPHKPHLTGEPESLIQWKRRKNVLTAPPFARWKRFKSSSRGMSTRCNAVWMPS